MFFFSYPDLYFKQIYFKENRLCSADPVSCCSLAPDLNAVPVKKTAAKPGHEQNIPEKEF